MRSLICTVCQRLDQARKNSSRNKRALQKKTDMDGSSQRSVFSAELEKVVMLPRLDMFINVFFAQRIIAFNKSSVPLGGVSE